MKGTLHNSRVISGFTFTMNIFLPYEHDIQKSVQTLDDLRLNKQILECYQLLTLAIDEQNGIDISKRGYKNHPIYSHYKNEIHFLCAYGITCCNEYYYRHDKNHKIMIKFIRAKHFIKQKQTLTYTPFYMEGSKGQLNYIRTFENVSELYQNKLISKWINDKKPPKWTNREMPSFYKEYLDLIGE